MSTHACIVLHDEKASPKFKAIHCWHDGYPSHVGRLLKSRFDTKEKVQELISMGHLDSLGENPKKTTQLEVDADPYKYISAGDNLTEIIKSHYPQYTYVFRDNQWFLAKEVVMYEMMEYTANTL